MRKQWLWTLHLYIKLNLPTPLVFEVEVKKCLCCNGIINPGAITAYCLHFTINEVSGSTLLLCRAINNYNVILDKNSWCTYAQCCDEWVSPLFSWITYCCPFNKFGIIIVMFMLVQRPISFLLYNIINIHWLSFMSDISIIVSQLNTQCLFFNSLNTFYLWLQTLINGHDQLCYDFS